MKRPPASRGLSGLFGLARALALTLLLTLQAAALQAATPTAAVTGQPAPAAAPAAPAAVTTADILARAEQDQRVVDRVLRRLARPDASAALLQQLQALAKPVEEKQRAYTAAELRRLPVMRLESLDRHWAFDERRFQHWQVEAQRTLGPMADDAAQLTRLRAQWEATRAAADTTRMPAALADRVAAVLGELESAEQALSPALAQQIALGQQARALDTRIQAGRDEVASAITDIDRRLLRLDAPPLWAVTAADLAGPGSLEALQRGLDIESRFAADYLAASPPAQTVSFTVQILLLPLLLAAALRERRLAAAGHSPEDDPAHLLRRPLSAWLLLAMLTNVAFKADAPLLQREVALLLALVPALRLLPARRLSALSPWPQAAITLYALNWLCVLVMDSGHLYRLLQLGLAVAALALMLWMLRAEHRLAAAGTPRLPPAVRTLAWAGVAGLAVGALAHVFGNVTLGETLINGVFDSAYLALLLHTGVALLLALLSLVPGLAQGTRLAALHTQAASLMAGAAKLLNLAALLCWLAYAADAFRLLRPTEAVLAVVLGHHFEIGEISLSLGDGLVFMVSVLVAFWTASAVRGLLRGRLQDITSLPRGAGNSIASLTYYALLLLGFVLALSAAGFQVSQLALIFGALGVGIGFGLQNIVNNFISGVVLMFERPVQPGDVVEVAGTSGRVREIGLRATILRTFDGADVVVPNGTLLASPLTNWTLFDRSRRVEVKVGVTYGADVPRVLQVLQAAALATPGVAQEPPAAVLFTGYGDSSLDFVVRVWTHDFDRWVALRGELLARVVVALREANIPVPYNQLDVNLHTVPDTPNQEPPAQ